MAVPIPPTWFRMPQGTTPAGYARLIRDFGLNVPPPIHLSFIASRGSQRELVDQGRATTLYTCPRIRSRRHYVHDNLLGTAGFCPIVRRTATLTAFAGQRLDEQARALVSEYDEELLKRAVSYLYTKETRSSFSLEGENP